MLFVLFFCVFTMSTVVFGYTVDDVRDIMDIQRFDTMYTESEIETIIEQYTALEKVNLKLKLFELGKDIDINTPIIEERERLEKEFTEVYLELEQSFTNGETVSDVLKSKAKMDNIQYQIDSLKDLGFNIEVNYIENTWEEKFEEIENLEEVIGQQGELGTVGQGLMSPISTGFIISEPFGYNLSMYGDSIDYNNGLYMLATRGSNILSIWNGAVTEIVQNIDGEYSIEVTHDLNLKTYYDNIDVLSVSVGDTVKQYTALGSVSKQKDVQISVLLDSEYINPLYLFGSVGLNAFREYISYNTEWYFEGEDLKEKIKYEPTVEAEEEVVEKQTFDVEAFYERVEAVKDVDYNRVVTDRWNRY